MLQISRSAFLIASTAMVFSLKRGVNSNQGHNLCPHATPYATIV